MESIGKKIYDLADKVYIKFKEVFDAKINDLLPEEKERYSDGLMGVLSSRHSCLNFGSKSLNSRITGREECVISINCYNYEFGTNLFDELFRKI